MNKDLFTKALELHNEMQQVYKEGLHERTTRFLKEYMIPNEVVDFLNTFSFNKNIRFKHVYFYRVNDIFDNNTYEDNKRCLEVGLLILGSGLNGDFITFDLKNLKVGYVFHDDLWEDSSINPREIFINLDCTIGEFYYNSMIKEDFPVDGLEAEEYLK